MIEKLTSTMANFISKNKNIQKLFNAISDNASQISVKTSNSVNFIARPITIMATTKTKNLLDGAYCASSSIASGISETITGKLILNPFNKAVKESTKMLESSGFFSCIAKKNGITPDNAKDTITNTLGRLLLVALVPLNGIFKGSIHPLLAHTTKSITEKVKGKKLNALI